MEERVTSAAERSSLHRFMERARKALGHDLRTPLGTIVNYASVLEEDSDPAAVDVRELTQRIRGHAMHTAEMLQLLLDAMLIAARPPTTAAVDAATLLESVVSELDGAPNLRVETDPGATEDEAVELDSALVAFAWRAFLDVEKSVSPRLPREARIHRDREGGFARVTLRLGAPAHSADLDAFLRRDANESDVPPPRRFALTLARDLVVARGGRLELSGHAGRDAAIRLDFPLVD